MVFHVEFGKLGHLSSIVDIAQILDHLVSSFKFIEKKKVMELSSKMIIFFKELSVNFHPWLYQNRWHRSGDTVQEIMTCSHCRICQPCLLSYQTAKRYANDTYRVSIKYRYVSYRIVPAKRYEPLAVCGLTMCLDPWLMWAVCDLTMCLDPWLVWGVWPYHVSGPLAYVGSVWPYYVSGPLACVRSVWPYHVSGPLACVRSVWPYHVSGPLAYVGSVWPYHASGRLACVRSVWPYHASGPLACVRSVWPYHVSGPPGSLMWQLCSTVRHMPSRALLSVNCVVNKAVCITGFDKAFSAWPGKQNKSRSQFQYIGPISSSMYRKCHYKDNMVMTLPYL